MESECENLLDTLVSQVEEAVAIETEIERK